MLNVRWWYLALAALAILPVEAWAQVRASELATVSQTVDGTTLTVEYSRPRARGRSPVYGKVIPWGEVWTPGANWATTLEVSKPVTINGREVAVGKYSVWMILKETGDWTTVLDPEFHRFHMEPPDSAARQIRFPVKIDQAPSVDVLTWSFPELTISGGTIAMQWGTTRATMKFSVQPSLQVTLAEAEARPYLGRYQYTAMTGRDSGKVSAFVVSYENGTMKGEYDPTVDWMGRFALIRVAPDVFVPGLYDSKGELYEVLRPDMIITFTRVNGRPMTFEERWEDDTLGASGKRLP